MEWVKVMCNFLDHRKIRLIRKGSKGDSLVLLWLLLITEAGKCGRGGALMISENNPYTAETLSLLLDMPMPVIEQGLELFARLEMVEREEGVFWIRNWRKYQSEDKLEIRREKERLRQQRHREKVPEVSPSVSRDSHAALSRDVTLENRQEQRREEQSRKEQTTDRARLLLSQTVLSRISDQELGGLLQRYGPQRLQQAADVAAETWRRDRSEIRNPGGYLNTLCENLVLPDWYVPLVDRQKRELKTRRRQEMQAAGQAAHQVAEEVENMARDQLWQSLTEEQREQFCAVAREDYPVGAQTSGDVVVILAKMKAWEARQVSGCS